MNPAHNIVVVNDTAHINGGAAKVAISSAIGLAQNGWNVFFLCAVGPVAPELQACKGLKVICTEQFEILTDPNRFRAMTQGLWNTRAGKAMEELLSTLEKQPTVVHVHLWAKALTSSVVRAAVNRGVPVVLTLHDYLYACPTGTLFDHQKRSICELTPMSARCLTTNCDSRNMSHKLWRTSRHLLEQTAGGFAHGITAFVALGKYSLEILSRYLPGEAQVKVIPNFADIAPCPPTPVAQNQPFGFSGRLVAEKGAALAATAAHRAGVALTCIGEGYERDLVSEIYPATDMLGWLSSKDSIKALRKCRALIVSSLWLEVQPLVILEALANGIPVILPDRSAARDLVEDGVTGLWFRMGDADDLAKKLTLLMNADYVSRLGQAAYDRYWSAPPTLDRHVENLEALYHDILLS